MLTMIHQNPVTISGGEVLADRKFHAGMLEYAKSLGVPIRSVNPLLAPDQAIMDPVRIKLASLPYEIVGIALEHSGHVAPASAERLEAAVQSSRLVYGQAYGAAALARRFGVPYVALVEYDLSTRLRVSRSQVSGPIRQFVRTVKTGADYLLRERPILLGAAGIHCNGYPIFDQVRKIGRSGLLYLDSRQTADMLIEEVKLDARINNFGRGPLKLLFSGRFEPMKGVMDAVRVGVECKRIGLDVEFDLFGQGSLKADMLALVEQSGQGGSIRVHDAIPFGELFERSKAYDAFLCCHDQADPSCTYLEAMGAGLPIVGYGNAMWSHLNAEADAGVVVEIGDVEGAAIAVQALARDPERYASLARNARAFAAAHTFEAEFAKRVADLRQMYLSAANHKDARWGGPVVGAA
jgi:colanic acid/amylovoran biosynthesis glycosyltransferase